MARVLIGGCGYVGRALAQRFIANRHEVYCLSRHPGSLPLGARSFPADLTKPETLRSLPRRIAVIFYTAAADSHSDDAYRAAYVAGLRNVLEALYAQQQTVKRIFFTSSSAVYAQSNGEWVDESSPTAPTHFSGTRLLEAERLLFESGFPATVVRLGGIYGPERTRLIDQVRRGEAISPAGEPISTNRIHRDDAAGALAHLMTLEHPQSLYLGVDHEPADQGAVLRWLAERLGATPPRIVPSDHHETAGRQSNKRCRNARLLASGYVFRFPTYREGYTALLAEVSHPGESNSLGSENNRRKRS